MNAGGFLAIVLAAVAAWLFGAVYYGLLGKAWLAAQDRTIAQMRAAGAGTGSLRKVFPFVLSFVAEIIIAWMLARLLTYIGPATIRAGAIAGALCWAGFVLTTIAVNNAYAGRRATLTAIDSGHWLGALVIIGAVLGALA